jgi:adenylosuccinate synthase
VARIVLVLSGEVGAGKTTFARELCRRYNGERISTHDLLVSQLGPGTPEERGALQQAGERLDRRTGGAWVRAQAQSVIGALPEDALVLIDSVRIKGQLDALRDAYGVRVVHVHLTAPLAVLRSRYAHRSRTAIFKEFDSYDEVQANSTEAQVDTLRADADVAITTDRNTPEDVVVRVASHLGLNGRDTGPLVDVIVGGEYGSEGKGNICYYLRREYDLLVRVGGPNAGHMVPRAEGDPFKHQLLPSGTWNSAAKLLIGPGAVLDLDILLKEIADCEVDHSRLSIDPQALVITAADKRAERRKHGVVDKISSTGSGTGAATARRILNRGKSVKLVRDVPALEPYRRSAVDVLEAAYAAGHHIMLEGTQGTMLSLYHGEYPFVTSRDTTAAGCLAEAGISPRRVRKIVLVCRTYPIRVGDPPGGTGTSGHMSQPLSWQTIADRSGLSVGGLRKVERGTVSGKRRRVAEFDWVLLRKAAQLNGPTDVALTFADYLHKDNRDARRLDQLHHDTIRFIEEVERVAGAPVSLISTRFHPRSIIDRRHW